MDWITIGTVLADVLNGCGIILLIIAIVLMARRAIRESKESK